MLGKKVLNIDDGEERVDIMTIRPDQGIAYPGFGEHEYALDAQVF